MNIEEYFDKMKSIQIKLMYFIENETNTEAHYDNLIKKLNDERIFENHYIFKSTLQLLSNISKNHYRDVYFYGKIQRILFDLKNQIKQTFSNFEIFNFFKSNKKILLFLIQTEIVIIDNYISDIIQSNKYKRMKYPEYFLTEIEQFKNNKNVVSLSKTLPINYNEKRLIGENENYICQLIREDSIEEFKKFIETNNFSLNANIQTSIYETNSLLLKKNPTLIEYSAFYGSYNIFRYLHLQSIEIKQSIWIYVIHGNNPELIKFIEGIHIIPDNKNYERFLEESIKCHHNEIASYIISKYIDENDKCKFGGNVYDYGFHYHNFLFLSGDPKNKLTFFYACKYDYINIVKYYMQDKRININDTIIQKIFNF